MVEILHDFQAHQAEIGGIAQDDRQIDARIVVQRNTCHHIDESRQIASDAHTRHERQLFHLVLEQFHLVIVHRMIVDVIAVFHL